MEAEYCASISAGVAEAKVSIVVVQTWVGTGMGVGSYRVRCGYSPGFRFHVRQCIMGASSVYKS